MVDVLGVDEDRRRVAHALEFEFDNNESFSASGRIRAAHFEGLLPIVDVVIVLFWGIL